MRFFGLGVASKGTIILFTFGDMDVERFRVRRASCVDDRGRPSLPDVRRSSFSACGPLPVPLARGLISLEGMLDSNIVAFMGSIGLEVTDAEFLWKLVAGQGGS